MRLECFEIQAVFVQRMQYLLLKRESRTFCILLGLLAVCLEGPDQLREVLRRQICNGI
jgi:hypothetical protein